jgi:hypothetical protein
MIRFYGFGSRQSDFPITHRLIISLPIIRGIVSIKIRVDGPLIRVEIFAVIVGVNKISKNKMKKL